jgi:hypothetical protein
VDEGGGEGGDRERESTQPLVSEKEEKHPRNTDRSNKMEKHNSRPEIFR